MLPAPTAYEEAEPLAFATSRFPRLSKSKPNGVAPADAREGCAYPAVGADRVGVDRVRSLPRHHERVAARVEGDLRGAAAAGGQRLRRAGQRRQAVAADRETGGVAGPACIQDVQGLPVQRGADRANTARGNRGLELDAVRPNREERNGVAARID